MAAAAAAPAYEPATVSVGKPAAYSGAVTGPMPYGNFFARFFALLIDEAILGTGIGLVYGILAALVGALALVGIGSRSEAGALFGIFAGLGVGALAIPIGLCLTLWYFVGLETGPKQATWGKQIFGLKIVRTDGRRISKTQSAGRFLIKHLFSGAFLMIGFLIAAFTDRKQALHDLAAGTIVVRTR
jgi:uncharacterized RDD family membrane protein YckC